MRKVLLVMLVLALPAIGGAAAWARSSAVAPSVGPCSASALSGTFKVIPGSAGAGNISYRLTLVNTSRSTCFVTGIPTLVLLDRKGKALPTAVRPAARGVGTAAMIQLAPGSAATADARFSPDVPGAGEQHPGACEKTAYWLRVSPAPGRGSLRAPISPPTPVCEKGTLTFSLLRAAPATGIDLLKTFRTQLQAIRKKTSVPVLLPSSLPFAGKVPKLYATGTAGANHWLLDLSGAPNCNRATACFFASFEGSKGGKLPRKANLRLAGGDPAVFLASTCGASCSPATLWFTHAGVLYTWSDKVLVTNNAKSVLARLAAEAIAAGPR